MGVYKFREGYSVKGDVQAIGERLDSLVEKNNGDITPEIVLKDAESKRSPLHSAFEWNDSAAAHAHRLEQARYLIRAVKIEHVPWGNPGDKEVQVVTSRAFPHVRTEAGPVYTTIGRVMADEALRGQLLADAKRSLGTWRKNYADLQELAAVYEAVDAVLLTEEFAGVAAD